MEKNSSPAETSGKQKVRSAEVGTDILKALAELSPATSLSRLAEHVGMPASKVHRYLQALIASGFAVQDASTNHYSLGREALRVGLAALDSMDVLKSAAAPLAELRDELNETCFLAVWGNRGATVVQVEQAVRAVTVVTQVGSVLPLLGSSTGLVFAASCRNARWPSCARKSWPGAPTIRWPTRRPTRCCWRASARAACMRSMGC